MFLSGTTPSPIHDGKPTNCPYGYRKDPVTGQCVKTISSVDRVVAQQPYMPTVQMLPSAAPSQSMNLMGDGLLPIYGTVGTILNTALSVVVVAGAIGGLVFLVRSKSLPFMRKK